MHRIIITILCSSLLLPPTSFFHSVSFYWTSIYLHINRQTPFLLPLERRWRVSSSHLHPEEQSLWSSLELQHKDTSGSALAHLLEFTVIGKDDQVLVKENHNKKHSRESGGKQRWDCSASKKKSTSTNCKKAEIRSPSLLCGSPAKYRCNVSPCWFEKRLYVQIKNE